MSAPVSPRWSDIPAVPSALDPGTDWPVDPYLLWAELTDYAGIRRAVLPFLIELSKPLKEAYPDFGSGHASLFDAALDWAEWSRFVTLSAPFDRRGELFDMLGSHELLRLQLGAARGQFHRGPGRDFGSRSPLLSSDAIAVVDDGCCLAHENFRSPGGLSRFLIVWDQSPDEGVDEHWSQYKDIGPVVSYGVEIGGKGLEDALKLLDGSGQYPERAFYDDVLKRPKWGRKGRIHGAGVLDLVAGPRVYPQPRPVLPLIFVQLPEQTVDDTSGGSLGNYVIDAARYVAARTPKLVQDEETWKATVNISLGSIAGPHDGSTITELALDELVDKYAPHVRIVMAAGNTCGLHVHSTQRVSRSKPARFRVMVAPCNLRASFVEVWIRDGVDALTFKVSDPVTARQCDGMAELRPGTARVLRRESGDVVAAAILCKQVAQGQVGTMLLLAISPTTMQPDKPTPLAEYGVWEIEATSSVDHEIVLEAWVERNDTVIEPRRAQQSHFIGNDALDPDSEDVNDRSTLSSIANGQRPVVVGAYSVFPGEVTSYSANGPVLGQPDRTVPEIYGPSDWSSWRTGMRVTGFYSGSRSRLSGTSAAAPRVARWYAEGEPGCQETTVAAYVDPEKPNDQQPQPNRVLAVEPETDV